MKNVLIVGLLVLSLVKCYGYTSTDNVLLLTDIHFNPYFECSSTESNGQCKTLNRLIEEPIEKWPAILSQESVNGFKEETNNAFLIRGFTNLKPIAKSAEAKTIFITGDLLSHNFNLYYSNLAPVQYDTQKDLTNFSYKTITYILYQLQIRFPNDKIYMVLGNNDSDYGDYNLPSADFLNLLGEYLSVSVSNKKEFIDSFGKGGYFSTNLSSEVTLIGLNTNLLSAIDPNIPAAEEQFNWLKRELANAEAAKRKVIFLQHIPYGVDLYKTATSGITTLVLESQVQSEYLSLLKQYSPIITTIYAGHYHAEYLAVINASTPLIGSVAFNTLFGNNPGFKIVNIGKSGEFAGYDTYYSDLNNGQIKWSQLYSYSQIYGQPEQIVSMLNQFPFALADSKVIDYRKYFNGNNLQNPQPISIDDDWIYYYCGIKSQQQEDFNKCI